MPTYLIKIETEDSRALFTALDGLTENGANYYTLTEDGRPCRPLDHHLAQERFEAELHAAARGMFEAMLASGLRPPTALVEAFESFVQFSDDAQGAAILARYHTENG